MRIYFSSFEILALHKQAPNVNERNVNKKTEGEFVIIIFLYTLEKIKLQCFYIETRSPSAEHWFLWAPPWADLLPHLPTSYIW